MRLIRVIMLAGLTSFCQFSCGGKASDNTPEESVAKTPDDPKARGGNTCLLGYADKLDQLLPLEEAARIAGLTAESATVKYSKALKNTAYHDVRYRWKSDRKRNMKDAGFDMELPADNLVQLNGIKERSFESFKMSHRKPKEEELKHQDKAIDEAFDKKSGNKKVDEQVDKLDEMKVDKGTQKSVAKSMGGVFAKAAQAYSDVPGIGEAASWNSFEKRLYALDNGVEISVTVDLSDDDAVNKQKATELIKLLLAKCE